MLLYEELKTEREKESYGDGIDQYTYYYSLTFKAPSNLSMCE